MGTKNSTQDYRSALKKAKNHGSAKHGSGHWMAQRVTAIALIPLTVWFVYSVIRLAGSSHADFVMWLQHPFNAIAMILFVIASFYHGVLGSQVVVEDYIHTEWFKTLKLIANKLFFFALGTACIFSILKIAFGG
ncbi:MAG: succinate dehydrogenase, hydrophobic membrane anchor protein [Bdellovibrionales bacterium]